MRPGWIALPISLLALVVVGLPLAVLTESDVEKDIKGALGLSTGECVPTVDEGTAWQSGPSLSAARDEPRAVTAGNYIYLVGGVDAIERRADGALPPHLNPLDELTRFDPRQETYVNLAPMPRALNHMALAAFRGDLYVLGGYERSIENNTSAEFYRYDTQRNLWTTMPSMPEPRAAMAVGVIGDRLYVAGGAANRHPLRGGMAFDFGTGRWSRIASMPSAREHVAGAVLDGKLYALGGRAPHSDALDEATVYDPATDSWRELPPLPEAAGGLDAVAVDGQVLAIGGGNDRAGTVTGAVQSWRPGQARWRRLPNLRTPRHGHSAAAFGDRVYVFGGSPCAYFAATDDVEYLESTRR